MKGTQVFQVEKFFPPRCPNCEQPFASADDFASWAGQAEARSYAEAAAKQAASLPELFEVNHEEGVVITTNRFHSDFIICTRCDNKTFRILYGTSQVFTQEEAERLVSESGYTCIREARAYGTAARRQTALSFLGQADVGRLVAATRHARSGIPHDAGPEEAGDVFASLLDPAISGLVRQIGAREALDEAEQALEVRFGESWNRLMGDCRRFLATGEVLLGDLRLYASLDPAIDFSPAVAAYSKALEVEVHERLFSPWRDRLEMQDLPGPTGQGSMDRSLEALRAYSGGSRPLTLGDMSYCLRNVGCRLGDDGPHGYARFLEEILESRPEFCDRDQFPKRLQKYVMKYRNAAAHVERLSQADCEGARAYLLEEPVELLLGLTRSLR